MPLRFSGTAAQVFFWIFLTLFWAAELGALIFAFSDKPKKTAAASSVALLFLSVLLICLAPTYPLIYLSCILAAVAAFGQTFEKFSLKLLSLLSASLGEGLIVVQICLLFPFPVPAAAVCVILPPLLSLGTLKFFYLVQRRCGGNAFRISELVMRLSGAVFAVVLLFEKLHFAPAFLLAGDLYLLTELCFPPKRSEKFGRTFFKTGFFAIGNFLSFLALSLCIAA